MKYGIPVLGTMAHSWIQMFGDELEAFKQYCRIYPDNALLLVDTYDVIKSGIPNAIKAFNEVLIPMGKRPKGIRLDSGDIAYLSKKCRKMLDEAGFEDCKIFASNSLDENIVKDLHAILTENIIVGGIYRNEEVRISGAGFTPPAGNEMYMQIKNFYEDLKIKEKELNPIELAAWTHAEFVRIHPFVDGNGRTSRLIMNYQLLLNGYLPVSVAKENRLDYYNALEQYAVNGNLKTFADFVAELEEVQLDEYIKLV